MDKKVCVTILLAMLATAVLCAPMAEPESAKRDLMKKELIRSLNQLREAIEGDQEYTGWMDFGRRSSEE